ncbi:hypothetical protein HHI36_003934, partial [Cryptolaemus montrouzieri]
MIQYDVKLLLENLKSKAQSELRQDYEISVGKMMNPKIKIIYVKESLLLDEQNFSTKFTKQNLPDGMKSDVKIFEKYSSPKNEKNTCQVLLELTPQQFRFPANGRQRVHLDWDSYTG